MGDSIELADGRTVGYADCGDSGDTPVIWCHGGPGSRLGVRGWAAAATGLGLRLIGIDRPGYGLSTPVPGRTFGSWVPDALAVADHLGVERFVAVGTSTGGAYALALAALAPERVIAAVVACGLSDLRSPENKASATVNRMGEFWDAPSREKALALAVETLGEDGSNMGKALENVGLTDADLKLVTDPYWQERWTSEIPTMFQQGVVGYTDDRLTDAQGWTSFDVAKIHCPVIVLHGEGDTGVPVSHARYTASIVPGAELRTFRQHGHFSISTEVLPTLAPFGRKASAAG